LISQGLPAIGRQTSAESGKQAIFKQNASISLARWHWRLLHYFKQVVNLSATCCHVELEQFSACFRVARVCQRQLGFLDDAEIMRDTPAAIGDGFWKLLMI